MRKIESLSDSRKAEQEEAQIRILQDQLKYWDSTAKVMPYYDPVYDVDRVYSEILQKNNKLPKDINIDDPLAVMNFIGKTTGHIFYSSIPSGDKKVRDFKRREYEKKKNKYAKKNMEMPPHEKHQYELDTIEPEPAKKTKLYPYSILNPNGMFSSYNFPIESSYIPNISDIEASKLLNRNYGTMHDMLHLGDLDFEGTYLPHVVLRNDGEILESYPDYADGEPDPGGDPEEIKAFLEETLDRKDFVAIIECEI